MLRYLLFLSLTVGSLTIGQQASAYPNFISYGYQSCMSCHYNPYGNGPLTDYGRSVAATEIASRYFVDERVTDEELAESSAFPGQSRLPEWIRPALNYRGLGLMQNLTGENPTERFVTMDFSGSIVAKFLPGDTLIFVAQMAYAPPPAALSDKGAVKNYRSREFYAGYRITKSLGIYGGLMDKVFGVRVPDHIAYSRTLTGLAQNDQTHGLLVHYVSKSMEIGLQPFIGNLVQQSSLRQKGITSQFEFTAASTTRIGASYLRSASDVKAQQIAAVHARTGIDQSLSLLAEVGRVNRTIKQTNQHDDHDYLLTQSQFKLVRGLWTLLTVEATRALNEPAKVTKRVGPGLQIFPRQNMELRADGYITFLPPTSGSSKPQIDLAAQLHMWL